MKNEVLRTPNKKALMGNVRSISLQKEMSDALAEDLKPQIRQIQKVEFEGGQSGLLDTAISLSKVWAKIIESRWKRSMPVYVEIDSQTHFITELLLPKEAEVNSLRHLSTEEIEVTFRNAATIHYLREENPDFSALLKTLQAAQEKNTPVLITDTDIDHEIIDVKPVQNFSPSPVLQSSSSPSSSSSSYSLSSLSSSLSPSSPLSSSFPSQTPTKFLPPKYLNSAQKNSLTLSVPAAATRPLHRRPASLSSTRMMAAGSGPN
jgi:hypothetical protein